MAQNAVLRLGLYAAVAAGIATSIAHPPRLAAKREAPASPTQISALTTKEADARPARAQIGIASWYGPQFQGRRTADGKRFDMHKLTTAHRSLPLGTKVRVTNLKNGRTVDVTISDRGPVPKARMIDLSKKAAQRIGMTKQGLARVRLEPLTPVFASN